MAKKKPGDVEIAAETYIAAAEKETAEKFGDGVMIDGESFVSTPRIMIPIGPSLDRITSGGIQGGSWVGITGPEKSGKTVTALSIAANCQKPEFGSRPVYYIKAEGRLSQKHLSGIKELNLNRGKFFIIRSVKGKILTAEKFLEAAANIIRTVHGACVILDSVSALCPEKEMNAKIGDAIQLGGSNKLFSQFTRSLNQVVPVNDSIILVISHQYANLKMPGMIEKSAKAVRYQYDYWLKTKGKKHWIEGNRRAGIIIDWECATSKNGPPGMRIESYFRFGHGIDRLYELVTLGDQLGFVYKAGSWYTLSYMKKYLDLMGVTASDDEVEKTTKGQGVAGVCRVLSQHPEWANALEKEISSFDEKDEE